MNINKIMKLVLILLLLSSSIPTLLPSEAYAYSIKTSKAIGQIKSNGNILEIIEPHLEKWGDQSVVSFKLKLTNNSNLDSNLARYSVKITTAQGVTLPSKLLDEKTKTIITPRSSTEVVYYGLIKGKATLPNMKFEITEWNIKYDNFKKKIGTLKIPASYQETTPLHIQKLANMNGIETLLHTGNVYWSKESKKDYITLDFNIYNQDDSTVTMPEYSYFLKTDSGSRYKLTISSDEQNVSIDSNENKQVKLYTAIPKGKIGQKMQLVIASEIKEDDKSIYAVEYVFNIDSPTNWQEIAVSKQLQESILLNDSSIQVDATEPLYVMRKNSQDSIAMKLHLKNENDTSVNLPTLTGFYVIGSKRYKVDFKVNDEKTKILPGETLNVELAGDVPKLQGTYSFKVILAEVLSSDEKSPVYYPVTAFHKDEQSTTGLNASNLKGVQYTKEDGTSLLIQLQTVNESKSGKKQLINGTYLIKNTSDLSYTLPTYATSLDIPSIGSYKGEILTNEQVELDPQATTTIKFSISVPSQLEIKTSYIQLKQKTFSSKEEFVIPIAQFSLNNLDEIKVSPSSVFDLKTEQGDYLGKVKGTYRLPMSDKDLLVTDVEITSSGEDSLTLPEFNAVYRVNKQTKLEAKIINANNVVSLNEDTLSYQIIAEVPYSSKIKQIDLYLQEAGDSEKDIGLQIDVSNILPIETYGKGKPYLIETTGNQSEVKFQQTVVYSSEDEDLIEIQMVQRNQDKRSTALGKLVAYLVTTDDIYYPLEIKSPDTRAAYQSKTLLSATSVLPKGVFNSNVKIIIGQAVSDNSLMTSSGSASAYIKAATFAIPDTVNTTNSTSNSDLHIGPYKLDIKRISANITSGVSVQYSVYADLSKGFEFNHVIDDYSVKIELVNEQGDTTDYVYNIGAKLSDNGIPLGESIKSFSSSSLMKYTKARIYVRLGEYESLLTTISI
ncbi:hypothetical protein PaeCFBP13512_19040 [Paenibacillus sp. CFBP13512]|uniref:hypothetical protein n=1 Tax=Paenibacillus sp. CFBP13512 TaxID=2184007 RepID=UPI0010C07359|nr:hypothetical protein [Paenibacillus sp. CFBP13512]TKJ87050.1 hypothetical protein PaeCFBP13512_19040 [Paenibacillus sp. CFBP13512]